MTIANTAATHLIHALKEWQIAVAALERGEMMVLLRKGGLREAGGTFAVPHDRVLLYPTYEHQRAHLVKPPYAGAITSVAAGWHPETILIGSWATITDVFTVQDGARVMALHPFHIWNDTFVTERLQWKPKQPIAVLLLRVYRLPQPQIIPYHPSYGGCKSWIDLAAPIAVAHSQPVLNDATFSQQRQQIQAIVAEA